MATASELVVRRLLLRTTNPKLDRLAGIPIPVVEEVTRQALGLASELFPSVEGLDQEWEVCGGCNALVEVEEAVHLDDEVVCKSCAKAMAIAQRDTWAIEGATAIGIPWASLMRARKDLLAEAVDHALGNDDAPADDPFWREAQGRWETFRDRVRLAVNRDKSAA